MNLELHLQELEIARVKSNPRSPKITWAAFLPGAIDTPGPGWLPELQRYTLGTGVLYWPSSGIGRCDPL